jgi:hypothetical protein
MAARAVWVISLCRTGLKGDAHVQKIECHSRRGNRGLRYSTGLCPVPVTLDGKQHAFPFVKTFSDVPVGKELFYIDSRGRLSIGINRRNFAETYKAGEGSTLLIPKKSAK